MSNEDNIITLPRTIGSAQRALGSIEGLVTAKEWERAAIVYAFTKKGTAGRPPANRVENDTISASEFARLGITGLRQTNTVLRYRNTWQAAVDAGIAEEVRPGQRVTVPAVPWSDYYQGVETRYVAKSPASIEKALTADPALAEAAAKVVLRDPVVRTQIAREVMADEDTATEVMRERSVRNVAPKAAIRAMRDEADLANPARVQPRPAAEPLPETHPMAEMGWYLGIEGGLVEARHAVRRALRILDSSRAGLDEDLRSGIEVRVEELEKDIAIFRAAIGNRINDADLAAFLAGDES